MHLSLYRLGKSACRNLLQVDLRNSGNASKIPQTFLLTLRVLAPNGQLPDRASRLVRWKWNIFPARRFHSHLKQSGTFEMPAKSKAQQKAAGAALAAKRGKQSANKLKGASKSMVKSMTESELEELASTKRQGKPEHVPKK